MFYPPRRNINKSINPFPMKKCKLKHVEAFVLVAVYHTLIIPILHNFHVNFGVLFEFDPTL
jgi:hypothetical protein